MEPRPPTPLNVSRDEAMKIVGIGRSKFNELVKAGEIKVVRIGRRVLVPVEPLRAWLKGLESVISRPSPRC